ncbi:MAG TPA: sensor domain-containing diguanylate cyclase [Spirochaetota bacterium]|nr:sensor domain-containing diguanylate cyclase [Spirochaetota bacterium]HRZ25184.1 sensor domain-containing diguanylate cyclase [Spirochaetota bacterium]HSA16117.1 sensor domain-containing diguanylate cyclase [Spirochaetota bacterium]
MNSQTVQSEKSTKIKGNLDMYEKRIALHERKIYDLKNLISLGISLSSNLNFQSLVESILFSCMGQMFVDRVAILLQVDIDEPNYYIHMSKGYDESFPDRKIILNENSSLLRYLAKNPDPRPFGQLKSTPSLVIDCDKLEILTPDLIVPMKSKNAVNGIIVLGKKMTGEEYSESEKEFLVDLGKFAAIAVENSRLYLMATLDRMTRLYIHHYFQERLLEAIKRCKRTNTPMSLIMSDIDHFKKFNDRYGHQQGDIVLKEVAAIFRQSIRSIDIPARYGGEEFAIILPETALADAIGVASRLRKEVEAHEFTGQNDPLHVTISLGIAQYDPERDKDKSDLISRADTALYRAKNAGRNRVAAYK